jgi:hypothetical protein
MSDEPSMPEEQFEIEWMPEAEDLLRKRDRFTRQAIKEDFARDPHKGAIELDHDFYATPVANSRFTVVWERAPNRQVCSVKAVVATRFSAQSKEKLKDQVREVVLLESRGKLKLGF